MENIKKNPSNFKFYWDFFSKRFIKVRIYWDKKAKNLKYVEVNISPSTIRYDATSYVTIQRHTAPYTTIRPNLTSLFQILREPFDQHIKKLAFLIGKAHKGKLLRILHDLVDGSRHLMPLIR